MPTGAGRGCPDHGGARGAGRIRCGAGALVSRAPGLVDVPFDRIAGTYVELLNGAAARKVVHPRPQKGPQKGPRHRLRSRTFRRRRGKCPSRISRSSDCSRVTTTAPR